MRQRSAVLPGLPLRAKRGWLDASSETAAVDDLHLSGKAGVLLLHRHSRAGVS